VASRFRGLSKHIFWFGADAGAKKLHQSGAGCFSRQRLEELRSSLYDSDFFRHGHRDPLIPQEAILFGKTLGSLLD
jgi:hypothetical protein